MMGLCFIEVCKKCGAIGLEIKQFRLAERAEIEQGFNYDEENTRCK